MYCHLADRRHLTSGSQAVPYTSVQPIRRACQFQVHSVWSCASRNCNVDSEHQYIIIQLDIEKRRVATMELFLKIVSDLCVLAGSFNLLSKCGGYTHLKMLVSKRSSMAQVNEFGLDMCVTFRAWFQGWSLFYWVYTSIFNSNPRRLFCQVQIQVSDLAWNQTVLIRKQMDQP